MRINTSVQSIILLFLGLTLFASCEINDFAEPGLLVPKTVDEDPKLPRIHVSGSDLHGETFGLINKPIMVFLHGGPGSDYRAMVSQKGGTNASKYPFERVSQNEGLSQLQDDYFCVFYDQKGAGLSPRFHKGEITFQTYLNDLDAIINHFISQKFEETGILDTQVYLTAWSYGGILATGYINEHPEKVKDVVFYEPGPFTPEAWEYFIENTTSYFGQIGEPWLDDFLLAHDHFTADDHIRADYQFQLGAFRSNPEFNEDVNTPMWRYGYMISQENLDFMTSDNYDISSNLSNFNGKALFIVGSLTLQSYPEYLNLQRPIYPRSDFEIVNGVGHSGPWEKANEIAATIRNYLR